MLTNALYRYVCNIDARSITATSPDICHVKSPTCCGSYVILTIFICRDSFFVLQSLVGDSAVPCRSNIV